MSNSCRKGRPGEKKQEKLSGGRMAFSERKEQNLYRTDNVLNLFLICFPVLYTGTFWLYQAVS